MFFIFLYLSKVLNDSRICTQIEQFATVEILLLPSTSDPAVIWKVSRQGSNGATIYNTDVKQSIQCVQHLRTYKRKTLPLNQTKEPEMLFFNVKLFS